MGEHAAGTLMPYRSDRQFALVDAEGGLGIGELDVDVPRGLWRPVGDVCRTGKTCRPSSTLVLVILSAAKDFIQIPTV